MTPDEKETYDVLVTELQSAKDFTKVGDFQSLFMGAEAINSALAFLADALIRFEQEYRAKILFHEEAGDSHARAETKAKTLEEYRKYRKLQLVYERADEHIKLLKKFRDVMGNEYQR